MLLRLQVRDFAIVDQIGVEFAPGMSVLTGETGAGKSILVDAVGLVLGDRGSGQLVRHGAKRAEFSAEFDVTALPAVRAWLAEQALDQDDECLLRRVISADGRSRAFINGNAVPVQQLKTLGDMLIDIHGQHFHQSLARHSTQRDLLDHYGGLQDQRDTTAVAFRDWQSLLERLERLQMDDAHRASRLDLLTFQLDELESLSVAADEVPELQAERQKLMNSGRLAEGVVQAVMTLSENDDGNASHSLAEAARAIDALVDYDPSLRDVARLIDSASIQVAEASDALNRYAESIEMDPARRDWVEERLDAIKSIARKHRVAAAELPALVERLRTEHDEVSHADERSKSLESDAAKAETTYRKLAQSLSKQRSKTARAFAAEVATAMDGLGMPGGKFQIALTQVASDAAHRWGIDKVEFLIGANPGQPLLPLSRVASGGELSRMSLAIQVIASDGSAIPTMVFDEVDAGVGGGVAEMVGRRLRELGAHRQVLCVTHLPQVASLADQHYRISKVSDGKSTRTRVRKLGRAERIDELARMLGGVDITKKTVEHAAEMLAAASTKRSVVG
jgi:DNA repair protein RecN (Recombination protein N)